MRNSTGLALSFGWSIYRSTTLSTHLHAADLKISPPQLVNQGHPQGYFAPSGWHTSIAHFIYTRSPTSEMQVYLWIQFSSEHSTQPSKCWTYLCMLWQERMWRGCTVCWESPRLHCVSLTGARAYGMGHSWNNIEIISWHEETVLSFSALHLSAWHCRTVYTVINLYYLHQLYTHRQAYQDISLLWSQPWLVSTGSVKVAICWCN